MTPMIDMTFQLICFFMVAMNFTDADLTELIRLPSSELAQPPDVPPEAPLYLQLTERGTLLYAGEELTLEQFRPRLLLEKQLIERLGQSVAECPVIIRADATTKAGQVQELIRDCQQRGFEQFALRAKQEEKI